MSTTNSFDQDMPAFRLAQTHFGDTLQKVAARELGDANKWQQLVWMNALAPPYLTDDPSLVADGVLLNGSLLRIPSTSSAVDTNKEDLYSVFESDVELKDKRLVDNGAGDFAVLTGKANLQQQLKHRIDTPRGQLLRHGDYGCLIHQLRGSATGPVLTHLGAQYVKAALGADYRVSKVASSVATATGDRIAIVSEVETIAGEPVSVSSSA